VDVRFFQQGWVDMKEGRVTERRREQKMEIKAKEMFNTDRTDAVAGNVQNATRMKAFGRGVARRKSEAACLNSKTQQRGYKSRDEGISRLPR
jgi:hypothetical protein